MPGHEELLIVHEYGWCDLAGCQHSDVVALADAVGAMY